MEVNLTQECKSLLTQCPELEAEIEYLEQNLDNLVDTAISEHFISAYVVDEYPESRFKSIYKSQLVDYSQYLLSHCIHFILEATESDISLKECMLVTLKDYIADEYAKTYYIFTEKKQVNVSNRKITQDKRNSDIKLNSREKELQHRSKAQVLAARKFAAQKLAAKELKIQEGQGRKSSGQYQSNLRHQSKIKLKKYVENIRELLITIISYIYLYLNLKVIANKRLEAYKLKIKEYNQQRLENNRLRKLEKTEIKKQIRNEKRLEKRRLDKAKKFYVITFFIITCFYFVIEIFINLSVFNQLSVRSDYFTVEAMEFWGKIITGIGAALAFSKIFYNLKFILKIGNTNISDYGPAINLFLLACIVSIPLSFYSINLLINYLVENSTIDDRNRAVLIVSAHSTMKPHYFPESSLEGSPTNFQKFISPLLDQKNNFYSDYEKEEQILVWAAKNCVKKSSSILNINSNINKAFFAINAFFQPLNEPLLKEAITTYHSCLLDNEEYQAEKLPKPEFDDKPFRDFYKEYQKRSEEYRKAYSEASNAYLFSSVRKSRVDKEWYKGVKEVLGFESNLRPYLSYESFVVHNDIQRYFRNRASEENKDLIPYSEGFNKAAYKRMVVPIKKMLPNTAIPTYIDSKSGKPLGDLIEYPENYKQEKVKITEEQIYQSGMQAYKGLIMPIVALSASLLFLILNIIMMLTYCIVEVLNIGQFNKNTFIKKSVIILFFVLLVINIPKYLFNETEDFTLNNDALRLLYMYEKVLTSLFSQDEKSIKYARIEKKYLE